LERGPGGQPGQSHFRTVRAIVRGRRRPTLRA
jgi:hypothetical protein